MPACAHHTEAGANIQSKLQVHRSGLVLIKISSPSTGMTMDVTSFLARLAC